MTRSVPTELSGLIMLNGTETLRAGEEAGGCVTCPEHSELRVSRGQGRRNSKGKNLIFILMPLSWSLINACGTSKQLLEHGVKRRVTGDC